MLKQKSINSGIAPSTMTVFRSPVLWLVLLIGFATTFVVWRLSNRDIAEQTKERFDSRAAQIVTTVEQRMHAYEQVLRGGVGLFRTQPTVTRHQWHEYVENADLAKNYPGIQNFAVDFAIPAAEKNAHIAQIRAEGHPEYSITPEQPERPVYHSLVYVEPFGGRNLRAFGFDMYTNPVRREAMDRAIDLGLPSVSGMVKLAQETNVDIQHGFIYCLPVYQIGRLAVTPEQRRAALLALVCGGFRTDDLMRGIFGTGTSDLELEVFDGAVTPETRMYNSLGNDKITVNKFSRTVPLEIGGRTWNLRVSANQAFINSISWKQSQLVLLAGALFSFGLFLGLGLWFDIERRTQATVRRNSQIFDAVQGAVNESLLVIDKSGIVISSNPTAAQRLALSPDQLIGRSLFEVMPPDTVAKWRTSGEEVMRSGRSTTFEVALKGRDYSISLYPVLDSRNQCKAIVIVETDITERKLAEGALRESEERFRSLYENSTVGVYRTSPDGRILLANPALVEMLGFATFNDLAVRELEQEGYEPSYPRAKFTDLINREGEVRGLESAWRRKDGTTIFVRESARAISDPQGNILHYDGIIEDITERRQVTQEIEARHAYLTAIIENQPGLLWLKDVRGRFLAINHAFAASCGREIQDVLGKTDLDIWPRELAEKYIADDAKVMQAGRPIAVEELIQDENESKWFETFKTPIRDSHGNIIGSTGYARDITERKQAETQIQALAFSDPLTGLPNRRLLMDRLEQAMVSAFRHGHQDALLFVDMDDFKTLNDSLGHDMGDQMLQQIAQRVMSCVREGDTVARLGGDEFVVLLEDFSGSPQEVAAQAEAVGRKIQHALRQPYQLGSHSYHSTASIGITLFGGVPRESIEEPLKRAEIAMYKAKAIGRDNLRFFEPEMRNAINARASLEADLHEAVNQDQFLLYYQAQVDADARPTGVEALVRWLHPKRGLISPVEFIPVAEASGLIIPLGHWVLETACKQLAAWAVRPELAGLTISVNVSARQFRWSDFVEDVLAVLDATGANPKRLRLELTESLLLDNMKDIIAKMNALKSKGVGFSLDDFGTGYSSLAYLKRLPLDELKIDQGFVEDILTDPNDAAIARMVVALAQSMGLAVIAEGVETQAQCDALAGMGCHAYQGYLFSRPLPIHEFEAFAVRA